MAIAHQSVNGCCISLHLCHLWCLSLTLQSVSGFCIFLLLCLLTKLILGSSGSGWLMCLCIPPTNNACQSLQSVSSYHALLHFKSAENACLWLSRMWVIVVPSCIYACWGYLPLVFQDVSSCYAWLHLSPLTMPFYNSLVCEHLPYTTVL